MSTAAIVLVALVLFLKKTRYGMIIRAGVENRAMVTALGIDVRRSFTLVFAIGGAAAGIGGVLAMHYTTFVSAHLGQTLLIFAFIVTVIGGLGSLTGAAIASVLVAVLQQFANVYLNGTGDFIVVALLAGGAAAVALPEESSGSDDTLALVDGIEGHEGPDDHGAQPDQPPGAPAQLELRPLRPARTAATGTLAVARGLAAHQHPQAILTLADQFFDLGHLVAAAWTLRLLIVAALIAPGIAPGASAPLRRLPAALAVISATAPRALSRH